VKRHGALSHNNDCMAIAPDGYSASNFAGSAVKRRVVSRTHRRQPGDAAWLAVMRDRDRDQDAVVQGDSSLSNAVPATPRWELARVAQAAQRIEACLQRSKSEAG
jgi:hypothetical protein